MHVHEPFAPSAASAALRHSRALNVGSFHSTTERFVSTQVARRVVELLFGRLDGRTASFAATRDLIERYFPGDYRIIRPGADLLHRPGSDGGPPEIVFSAEEERGALRLFLRALRRVSDRPRLARHDLAARPGLGAGDQPLAQAARAGAAGRARRRLGGPAPGPGHDRGGGLGRGRAGAAARAARAGRRRGAGGVAAARVRGGAARGRARPAVRAARRAHARRPARAPDRRARAGGGARPAHRRGPPGARVVARGRRVRGALRGDRRTPARQRQPGAARARAPARLHLRGPPHAHRPFAGLRHAGGHAARHRHARSGSARSR